MLLHPQQWKSCELIQYDCWDHMNMGVLLYNICKWCFSQNLSLDVVRVLFYLSIRSDIILLQINNYILEISYRFLEFVSHLAPSMSNILKCNEHQECLKTAKMDYFPMKMHDLIINSILLWNGMSPIYNTYNCNVVESEFNMSLFINITSSREEWGEWGNTLRAFLSILFTTWVKQ